MTANSADDCTPRPSWMGWVLGSVVAVFAFGVFLLETEPDVFAWWIREDGPVEWLTFWALVAAAAWATLVAYSWPAGGGGWARRGMWLAVALVCLFGALEEISYGQRVFGIETPAFIAEPSDPSTRLLYNRQNETNLHNLMLAGINVNKIVFGKLLALFAVLYLFVLPAVSGTKHVAALVSRYAIPIARRSQALILLAVALVTVTLTARAGKVAELQELVGCTVLLAALMDPANRRVALSASLAATVTGWRRLAANLLPRGPVLRACCVIVAVQLALGTALRLAFLTVFASTAGDLQATDIQHSMYLGLKFDLRLALLICLPFVLLTRFAVLNPWRSAGRRRDWLSYFVAMQALVLLLYFVDFGHYGYLHSRLNAGALDHILSAGIALGMVWETYPVVQGLLGLAFLSACYAVAVRRFAFRPDAEGPRLRLRRRALVGLALAVVYLFGLYGKWSWYPLRWSDAYGTTNGFAASLALNPVLFLFDTLPNRGEPYDVERVREGYGQMADLLELDSPDPQQLDFRRVIEPARTVPFQPNLVLIHLEAFAGHKVSALGNPLESSPEFDRLARDSLLFTNFFVPTGPTARSIFTMVTGTPDVNPIRSASRNPQIVDQHTLLNALDGYSKFYFLGGSATWANIRGLLAHNVDALTMFEEGDFDAPRVNVWGVSDMDLLDKADDVMRRTPEPFFAFIQTAGNHGPYTIPEDRKGFELIEVDRETLEDNGFQSLEAYNSFRLLDYSLGRFFETARRSPYFNRTVFVLYGDHGFPAPRATPWELLGLNHHHVPLLIHAPWLEDRAGRIDSVASLVDVLPTSLGLLGVPYTNTTLGRDLLAAREPERHVAFTERGLLTDEFLLNVDPLGNSHLFAYRSGGTPEDQVLEHPAEAARLRSVYEAFLATSRYLLVNNPPVDHPGSARMMARVSR